MPANASELRVFLSVDLVGSTKLKNELNQPLLREKFEASQRLIGRMRQAQPHLELSQEDANRAVLENLGIGAEEVDWATVVGTFYKEFHNQLAAELKDSNAKFAELDGTCQPWKAIGDELLYQIPVISRRHLYWVIVSFLKALRRSDKSVKERDKAKRGLRLKGTAWVAGFPVRNRRVNLPAVGTEDYLGPDIDTGFRIGACTRAGMLVVSVELAELLAETPDLDAFLGMIVGWQRFKGVWNDALYPIIWIDLPGLLRRSNVELEAEQFNNWQQQDCHFCRAWATTKAKNPLIDLADTLHDLRDQLHPNLGLVDPYIVNDPEVQDEMPVPHREINELQQLIEVYLNEARQQGMEAELPAVEAVPEPKIEKLVSQVLEQPSNTPAYGE